MLAPWKKNYDQPRQHIKKQRHYFTNKSLSSQSHDFSVVMYGCESWTIKKAEHQRIDAFELWCIDGSPSGSAVPGILQARTLEWVAISFSIAWNWKVKVKSLSHVWLVATPWTAAYQAPPSMGFSRQEYWSGLPRSLNPGDCYHAVFLLVWEISKVSERQRRSWEMEVTGRHGF